MTRLVLGNRHARHSLDNGETFEPMPKGKRATVIDLNDDDTFGEQLANITGAQGIWAAHAVEGATPAWVAGEDPTLVAAVAAHYGGIEIRKLQNPFGGGGKVSAPRAALGMMLALPSLAVLALRLNGFLKTNAGNDFQYNQMAGSASATAVAKFVGLTANTTAPAAGDTTLTAEITTAGGGLIRKAGTPAHTTSAASYTITTTFTANGSDTLPVTIGKRGIFDAVTAGNLVFEALVSPTATLSASGDILTLTDTITM